MIYIYCVGKTRRTWLGGFRLFYPTMALSKGHCKKSSENRWLR